jgi:hypothetical protein
MKILETNGKNYSKKYNYLFFATFSDSHSQMFQKITNPLYPPGHLHTAS